MATEAGMIVLDVLSVYTDKFKVGAQCRTKMLMSSSFLEPLSTVF